MSALQETNVGENGVETYSDGDDHVLSSSPTPENACGTIDYEIRARRVSDGAAKFWSFRVAFKRESSDVTLVGLNIPAGTGTTGDLIALTGATIDIVANGQNIDVEVNGIASTEIDWGCMTAGKYLKHE